VRLEVLREVEQLLRVAREPRELGKNEPLDVPAFHVAEHPLALRMIPHGFAAHAREVIDFQDRPLVELRIAACAIFVMRGAFALGLVFGGNANPNSNPPTFLSIHF